MYAPAPQAVHTSEVVAPVADPYDPAAQEVQPTVPVVTELYMPATHAAQTAPTPYAPAAQVEHTADEVAPATAENSPAAQEVQPPVAVERLEYVPTAQPVHADAPGVAEYLPGAHTVHVLVPAATAE